MRTCVNGVSACAFCLFARLNVDDAEQEEGLLGLKDVQKIQNGVISLLQDCPFRLLREHWHLNLESVETSAHLPTILKKDIWQCILPQQSQWKETKNNTTFFILFP